MHRRLFLFAATLAASAFGCPDELGAAETRAAWERLLAAHAGRTIVGVRIPEGKKRRTVRGHVEAVHGTAPADATFDFVEAGTGDVRRLSFFLAGRRPRVVVN